MNVNYLHRRVRPKQVASFHIEVTTAMKTKSNSLAWKWSEFQMDKRFWQTFILMDIKIVPWKQSTSGTLPWKHSTPEHFLSMEAFNVVTFPWKSRCVNNVRARVTFRVEAIQVPTFLKGALRVRSPPPWKEAYHIGTLPSLEVYGSTTFSKSRRVQIQPLDGRTLYDYLLRSA